MSFLSDKLVYQALLLPYTFRNCGFIPAVAIWDDSLRAKRDFWCSLEVGKRYSRETVREEKKSSLGKKEQMVKLLTLELCTFFLNCPTTLGVYYSVPSPCSPGVLSARPRYQGKAQWLGMVVHYQGTWQGAILCIHTPVVFLGLEGGALGWF